MSLKTSVLKLLIKSLKTPVPKPLIKSFSLRCIPQGIHISTKQEPILVKEASLEATSDHKPLCGFTAGRWPCKCKTQQCLQIVKAMLIVFT